MWKKTVVFVILAALCLGCTACWDRREPKQLGVIGSMVYDVKEGDGGYEITFEILNPSAVGSPQNGGAGGASSILYKAGGKSIPSCIEHMSAQLGGSLFLGHNQTRFFTEQFAKTAMQTFCDSVIRERLSYEMSYLMMLKDIEPKEMYEKAQSLPSMLGAFTSAANSDAPYISSGMVFHNFRDFINDFYTEGKEPVIGVITLDPENADEGEKEGEDKPEGGAPQLIYKGAAVFNGCDFAGYLTPDETVVYNMIDDGDIRHFLNIDFGGESASCFVNEVKCDAKAILTGENEAQLNITCKALARIQYVSEGVDLENKTQIAVMEQAFADALQAMTEAAVQKVQGYRADIFGFGAGLRVSDNKGWQSVKHNWDEVFSNAAVTVRCEVSFNDYGEGKRVFGKTQGS